MRIEARRKSENDDNEWRKVIRISDTLAIASIYQRDRAAALLGESEWADLRAKLETAGFEWREVDA